MVASAVATAWNFITNEGVKQAAGAAMTYDAKTKSDDAESRERQKIDKEGREIKVANEKAQTKRKTMIDKKRKMMGVGSNYSLSQTGDTGVTPMKSAPAPTLSGEQLG